MSQQEAFLYLCTGVVVKINTALNIFFWQKSQSLSDRGVFSFRIQPFDQKREDQDRSGVEWEMSGHDNGYAV